MSYIYKIESRTYTFKINKFNLPRKDKLSSRYYLGYLVSFEGYNIYYV